MQATRIAAAMDRTTHQGSTSKTSAMAIGMTTRANRMLRRGTGSG